MQHAFKDIVTFENNDDEHLWCDLCLDPNTYENNSIVICELCFTAVHQSCYGSELVVDIPSGEWFCERCIVLKREYKLALDSRSKF